MARKKLAMPARHNAPRKMVKMSKSESRDATARLETAINAGIKAGIKARKKTKPSPQGWGSYGWVWMSTPDKQLAKSLMGVTRKDRGEYRTILSVSGDLVQKEAFCSAMKVELGKRGYTLRCWTNLD